MAIPTYEAFMAPLLSWASDREEKSVRDAYEAMAVHFDLTEEEKGELLPSGRQRTHHNRVGWAKTYLVKAMLLESTRRGHFRITERGMDVVKHHVTEINTEYLKRFDAFVDFQNAHLPDVEVAATQDTGTAVGASDNATPEEALEATYQRLRRDIADELLSTVKSCSPAFFERLVVDLLVNMGYGGSRKEAGRAVGKSSDGGIDGIIQEDRLGLDNIYIQAKRWEGSVGRPEIQKFVDALHGLRARKGVFITTSRFTQDAMDFASHIDSKVILIDGLRLAEYMMDHGVGVSNQATYVVQKVDFDFFEEA